MRAPTETTTMTAEAIRWAVVGAQINAALYLGTVAYAAIFYRFYWVIAWALIAMALAYCSYIAWLWSPVIGINWARATAWGSIAAGAWAGIDLLLRL